MKQKPVVELVKPAKKSKKPRFKRPGPLTAGEHEIIETFAAEQTTDIAPAQVRALAQTLNRTVDTVKTAIEKARESFVSRAERYVNVHSEATEAALANGDAKSLEVAAKASQWAITNLSSEGKRIIEKETGIINVPRVMIAVKIGGLDLDKVQESDAVVVTENTH